VWQFSVSLLHTHTHTTTNSPPLCVLLSVQVQEQAQYANLVLRQEKQRLAPHEISVCMSKLDTVWANMSTSLVTFFGYFDKLEGFLHAAQTCCYLPKVFIDLCKIVCVCVCVCVICVTYSVQDWSH
jgi:hypothetical protein